MTLDFGDLLQGREQVRQVSVRALEQSCDTQPFCARQLNIVNQTSSALALDVSTLADKLRGPAAEPLQKAAADDIVDDAEAVQRVKARRNPFKLELQGQRLMVGRDEAWRAWGWALVIAARACRSESVATRCL